jgi:hypothetical protein
MAEERKPRSFVIWLAFPAFIAIAAFELAAPHINGKSPDWMVVGLCAAGAFWIAVVRPLLARPRK